MTHNEFELELSDLSLPERRAPRSLLEYLRGQLIDGVGKERHENERRETSINGSFYSVINEDDERFPLLVRGSVRFVMKLPHPKDTPGNFWEVFGIFEPRLTPLDFLEDDFTVLEERLSTGQGFALRRHRDAVAGDFVWADSDGAFTMNEFAIENVTAPKADTRFNAFRQAYQIYQDARTHNIVASI